MDSAFTPAQRRVIDRLSADSEKLQARVAAVEWLTVATAALAAAHAADPIRLVAMLRDMAFEVHPAEDAGPLQEAIRDQLEHTLGKIEAVAMRIPQGSGEP